MFGIWGIICAEIRTDEMKAGFHINMMEPIKCNNIIVDVTLNIFNNYWFAQAFQDAKIHNQNDK